MLEAGINDANQALADRRRFELEETRWEAFKKALDRPVQDKPRLRDLLGYIRQHLAGYQKDWLSIR